jgi:hypothetical protein
MAGVGSSLVADHNVGIAGQQVHDLAFAFITPLGTDNDETGHMKPERIANSQ